MIMSFVRVVVSGGARLAKQARFLQAWWKATPISREHGTSLVNLIPMVGRDRVRTAEFKSLALAVTKGSVDLSTNFSALSW